jgi:hypothetical protein
MRMFIPAVFCAAFVALPGCVTQTPVAVKAPPAPDPVAVGKSNRFEMIQNGRKMSARDFDAWMKARGIRIAKGAPAGKAQIKPQPKAQAKRR